MLLWLGCLIALGGIALVFLTNAAIIWYFSSSKEKSILSKLVTLIGISLSQMSIAIIPFDIYITSALPLNEFQDNNWDLILKIAYYLIFLSCILMSFIVVPFVYFYTEAEYIEEEDVTVVKKIKSAAKYSAVMVIIVGILFLLGLFLHTDHITSLLERSPPPAASKLQEHAYFPSNRQLMQYDDPSNDTEPVYSSPSYDAPIYFETNTTNALNYLQDLLDGNVIEYSISFSYFIITGIGFLVFWNTYTALGFSAVGVLLLKGTKRIDDESREIQLRMEEISKENQKIEAKYPRKKPYEVNKKYEDNQYEDEQLRMKLEYLNDLQNNPTKRRLRELLKPVSFMFGILMLLLSSIVIVSIVFTQFDRFFSSDCGFSCGFVVTSSQFLNPIDLILTYTSMYFPVDVVLFACLVAFVLIATFGGILTAGIRVLWIKLFSVRVGKTVPQALIFVTLILMLCSLCLMIEILVIAPQYSTFGSRTYHNELGEEVFCNMSAGSYACPMTVIAQIVTRFFASLSVASIAYYLANWLFILMCLVGVGVSIWLKKTNTSHVVAPENEDDYL